jgi:hypothetical protein
MFLNTLSGRFLILTIIFVMLAEVLIYVPSVARFREDYLLLRLERAQIASLALLANDMIDPRFPRGGDVVVVHRRGNDQVIGGQQLADELVGETKGALRLGSLLSGRGEVGA